MNPKSSPNVFIKAVKNVLEVIVLIMGAKIQMRIKKTS